MAPAVADPFFTAGPSADGRPAPSAPVVLAERVGRITLVTINRPEVGNAVDAAVTRGLDRALGDAAEDPAVAAVVLTGAGDRAFCAGMDLAFFAAHGPGSLVTPAGGFAGVVERDLGKPVIAAVNGAALAGGFEIALACDLVVAAEHATFGLPEVRRGLIAAAGGLARLPQRVPHNVAMELILTGRPLSAWEGYRVGLVNHVVPGADLLGQALDLAAEIAANAPLAIRASRRLVRMHDAIAPGDGDVWEESERELTALCRTDDVAEGVRAFREKRRPRWTGR